LCTTLYTVLRGICPVRDWHKEVTYGEYVGKVRESLLLIPHPAPDYRFLVFLQTIFTNSHVVPPPNVAQVVPVYIPDRILLRNSRKLEFGKPKQRVKFFRTVNGSSLGFSWLLTRMRSMVVGIFARDTWIQKLTPPLVGQKPIFISVDPQNITFCVRWKLCI
jgi:hypothetical protein